MIEIPLTKGKVALIDDGDEWVGQWEWQYSHHGYAQRSIWSAGKNKYIYMHRLILNAPDDLQVDHINHDGLDNRKSNLRLCTNAQNNMNRTKLGSCSSKYKGVTWHHQHKKWKAHIKLNGKLRHLGYFTSELEAAMTYNLSAQKYFGEFALLNRLDDER